MKIVIEETNTKDTQVNFSSHYYTIRYKTGLFFWKRVEEDLIFGMSDIKFNSIREAQDYIKQNILKNYSGDYSITVEYSELKYIESF